MEEHRGSIVSVVTEWITKFGIRLYFFKPASGVSECRAASADAADMIPVGLWCAYHSQGVLLSDLNPSL